MLGRSNVGSSAGSNICWTMAQPQGLWDSFVAFNSPSTLYDVNFALLINLWFIYNDVINL